MSFTHYRVPKLWKLFLGLSLGIMMHQPEGGLCPGMLSTVRAWPVAASLWTLIFSFLGFLLHKAFGLSTCQSCTEHWLRGWTLSPWQSGPKMDTSCVHLGQCLYGKRWEQWHTHYLVFDKNVLNSFYFLYYSTLEEERLVKSQKT